MSESANVEPRRRKPRYQNGSLSQRKIAGRVCWYGQWWEAGHHRAKVLGSRSSMSRGEAAAQLARIVEPLNQAAGLHTPGARVFTFREFVLKEYLTLKSSVWKPSTAATNEAGIQKMLLPRFGPQLMSTITRRELQAFISEHAEKYSRSIVGKLKIWLQDIFQMAHADGQLAHNPAAALQIPRHCRPTAPRRALTFDQAAAYLKALDLRERLIARLCLVEGMRKGEAFALQWGDVEGSTIHIRRRVYDGRVDTPKNGRRECGLSDGTRELLEAWRKEAISDDPGFFIFVSGSLLTPLRPENLWKLHFKPRLQPMGLDWASYHVLRHTNATLMRKKGIDAKVGADQRGHGLGVSLSTYTHSDAEQKRAAVQELENAINERKIESDGTEQPGPGTEPQGNPDAE